IHNVDMWISLRSISTEL
ncbi:hypothetical protein KIPB_011746, partial [Kipferlia bialata]